MHILENALPVEDVAEVVGQHVLAERLSRRGAHGPLGALLHLLVALLLFLRVGRLRCNNDRQKWSFSHLLSQVCRSTCWHCATMPGRIPTWDINFLCRAVVPPSHPPPRSENSSSSVHMCFTPCASRLLPSSRYRLPLIFLVAGRHSQYPSGLASCSAAKRSPTLPEELWDEMLHIRI